MRKVRKITSPGLLPENTCYQLALFKMPWLMPSATLLYKKKPIERLLPSLCETELKSSKTVELSAMRAWWVTRLSAVYWRKFIFMDMHVCSSKKIKVSLQMKIKIRSVLSWDFPPLFPIKKDERKKVGGKSPNLRIFIDLSKNIKRSKSVVKNLLIFSKK